MSYQTPANRLEAVEEALRILADSKRAILTTHINADGDGAGSQVALAGWMRGQGKESFIVNPTPFPESLEFLLPDEDWAVDPGSRKAQEALAGADLCVILDTRESSRIGSVRALVEGLPKLVIDHHPPGPEPLAGASFVDPNACATGELVFDLLLRDAGPWPREAVSGLYVALLADTGSFRFSNTTPAAHRMAAALIEKGADPQALHRRVFGNVPLRKLRLLQASLGELEVDPEGDLAWMTIPSHAFSELGGQSEDIEGLVDYPRDIDGVEVGILFRETAGGHTKISFRSNGTTDVNGLARRFGGGGHVKAAGALVERPLDEVRAEVLEAVRDALRGRERDGGG